MDPTDFRAGLVRGTCCKTLLALALALGVGAISCTSAAAEGWHKAQKQTPRGVDLLITPMLWCNYPPGGTAASAAEQTEVRGEVEEGEAKVLAEKNGQVEYIGLLWVVYATVSWSGHRESTVVAGGCSVPGLSNTGAISGDGWSARLTALNGPIQLAFRADSHSSLAIYHLKVELSGRGALEAPRNSPGTFGIANVTLRSEYKRSSRASHVVARVKWTD